MTPCDIECIVLGHVLRWGVDAVRPLLPSLTPDKFVFSTTGDFGIDHQIIWETIADLYLSEHKSPTYAAVSFVLGEEYHSYLMSLVDRLEKRYFIYELDLNALDDWASVVDKNGILYQYAHLSEKASLVLEDMQSFADHASSIKDIDEWLTKQLSKFRNILSAKGENYQPIANAVENVRSMWERQFKGEQTVLLPCGMPTLMAYHLFPVRKMAVVHGLSGSGKSAFVHQVNLGTAIGLVANKIRGCVAINSLEMEQEDLVERLASTLAHVDVNKFIDKSITEQEFEELNKWLDFIAMLPIFVDDTNFITTSALAYRSSGLHVSEHGPVLQLSSDYGELFKDDEGDSEEQRVNHVFREQFRLSRDIGASVIAISQSTANKAETGKTYVAGPDGTRYSRGVLQSADILLEVWNPVQMEASGRQFITPEDLNDAHPWVFIQKYRKGGKPGYFPLGWRADCTMFFDLGLTQVQNNETVFTHLQAAQEALGLGARVVPISDSPLGALEGWR